MKKSEIVNRTILPMLSEDTGLSESDIKIALTAEMPRIETTSIKAITNFKQFERLYEQAKSLGRKTYIAFEALNLCKSFVDFDKWSAVVGWDIINSRPVLKWEYSLRIRAFAERSIREATSFEQIHSIWVHLNEDILAVEDREAYQKMCRLIYSTNLLDVFKTFDGDTGVCEMLCEDSHHYEALMTGCQHATPEAALEVIQWLRDFSWNGEQDTYPVQLLIQKAAELYRK